MSSAVKNLQNGLLNRSKSVTQLFREAKVIATHLNVEDVENWVNFELNGYPPHASLPDYRTVIPSHIEINHPRYGWRFAGNMNSTRLPARQPISEIEELSKNDTLHVGLPQNMPTQDEFVQNWPQRLVLSGISFKHILEGAINQLLQWTIELQKRGIKGEDMNFDEKEKQSAANQTFNIGNFHGVLGNVKNSEVSIYDYSSVHQLIKEKGIPREERNELEDIMDGLKTANQEKKHSLTERGKAWIIKNKELLGASAEIVAKAINISLS